jgi:DNA-binding beta-propeller fold protein YncE
MKLTVAVLSATFVLTAVAAALAGDRARVYRVVERIKAPDALWDYAAIDADARRLYVGRFGGVLPVNLKTRTAESVMAPSALVHGVLPIPQTTLVLSTNGQDDTATLFDGRTGRKIADIATGSEPDAIVFDAHSKLAVVTNQGGHSITLIDAIKHVAVATVPVGGSPEAPASNGAGWVFVNIDDRNEIAVVDVDKRAVVRRIGLPGCRGPTGLAYDAPDRLLISACRNGVVIVTDAKSGKTIASVQVDAGPDDALFDPVRRLAFIPSGAGTLAVISISRARRVSLVQKVSTQAGARTAALDSATGDIYIPAGRLTAPTTPGRLHDLAPGSFEILVVSSSPADRGARAATR